jgi:hypothetical protein
VLWDYSSVLAVRRVAKALLVVRGISANATATGVARRQSMNELQRCVNKYRPAFSQSKKKKKRTNERRNKYRCGKHGIRM